MLTGLCTDIANTHSDWLTAMTMSAGLYTDIANTHSDWLQWQCRQVCTHTLPTPTVTDLMQWQCREFCVHTHCQHPQWLTYCMWNWRGHTWFQRYSCLCHPFCSVLPLSFLSWREKAWRVKKWANDNIMTLCIFYEPATTTTKLPLVGWLKFLNWIELNWRSYSDNGWCCNFVFHNERMKEIKRLLLW